MVKNILYKGDMKNFPYDVAELLDGCKKGQLIYMQDFYPDTGKITNWLARYSGKYDIFGSECTCPEGTKPIYSEIHPRHYKPIYKNKFEAIEAMFTSKPETRCRSEYGVKEIRVESEGETLEIRMDNIFGVLVPIFEIHKYNITPGNLGWGRNIMHPPNFIVAGSEEIIKKLKDNNLEFFIGYIKKIGETVELEQPLLNIEKVKKNKK